MNCNSSIVVKGYAEMSEKDQRMVIEGGIVVAIIVVGLIVLLWKCCNK